MNISDVEELFALSLVNNQQALQEAESQLLALIQLPESISIFIEIIQSTTNNTYLKASFIYLEKAIILQWSRFSDEEKFKLQSIILDLYFQNHAFQSHLVFLLNFFLANSIDLEAFLPFLTKEITPENVSEMIIFYSSIIESLLHFQYLEEQKDYILNLISKSIDSGTDNIDVVISTFRVSTFCALLFKDFDIIQDQIEIVGQILLNEDLSDTNFVMIMKLFKQVIPYVLEFTELQQFFYTISLSLAENEDLASFRRSLALDLTRFQIRGGFLETKDIIHLIDISFDLLVDYHIENYEIQQIDMINIISDSLKLIPEEDIFEYLSSIVLNALESETVECVAAGISVISVLMICCPFSFSENQEEEASIISTFLDTSYPEKIQIAALLSLQNDISNYNIFPVVFPQMLLPLIFYSPEYNISDNACSSLFNLTRSSAFNNKEFFQIIWENWDELNKAQPEYFMEILFQCLLGIDDLDQEIKLELINIVIFYLSPDKDSNLLLPTLLLSISALSFTEEPNEEILSRIYIIIENSLDNEDTNLFNDVMQFLFIFITQLKYDSFGFLQQYSDDIIKAIEAVDNWQTLFTGAAIVKYWECQQIMPFIYRRFLNHSIFIFKEDNENIEFNDDDDDEIEHSMLRGEYSYFRVLAYLVAYLEADEARKWFIRVLNESMFQFYETLPVLKQLIKHAHKENYDFFVAVFFTFVNKCLTTNDYRVLSLAFELSSELFSLEIDESTQYITEFIENLKSFISDSQLTETHIDYFIGILSDVVQYKKVNDEQILDLFLFVYSIVFQQPPQLMWQNIAYFINISLSNFPYLIKIEDFQNSIQEFIQILLNWISSNSENDDLDLTETNDNIASLILTIISLSKLNNEEILEVALNFFPPQDESETASMIMRIIEIYQRMKTVISVNSLSLIAASIIRFFTMGIKKRRRIEINEDMIQHLISILKESMDDSDVSKLVCSLFEDSPEKIEYISSLFE